MGGMGDSRARLQAQRSHPGAATRPRDGMEETLTLTRLGIEGKLRPDLYSTSCCEW